MTPPPEVTGGEAARSLIEEMPFVADGTYRDGERRRDDGWIARIARSADARAFVVSRDLRVGIDGDRLAWGAVPAEVDVTDLIYLGTVDGHPSFAVDGVERSGRATPSETLHVREAVGAVGPGDAAALLQGVGVISWHRRHPFCASCGSQTNPGDAGHVRRCASCGTTHFPRTDPAVIMLVTAGEYCVLGQRAGAPEGRWSTLAGYVEPGESLESAVARETLEEVGLVVDSVTYVGSQPWPFPASLMVAFEATAPYGDLRIDEEHSAVRWFERNELRRALETGEVAVPGRVAAGGFLIRRWVR